MSQAAQAWQVQTGDFKTWLSTIKSSPAVEQQIGLYFQVNQPGADYATYARMLPEQLKIRAFNEMAQATGGVTPIASCQALSRVDFLGKIFSNSPPVAADFEKEVLRIESLDCLGQLDLEKVFNVFLSDAFQKTAISGLKGISSDQKTNRICQDTKVFGVGRSSYCFTQNIWRNDNMIVIQSFNDFNKPGIEAPVYFREVVTVLERLANKEVIIYNLAFGRGPDLPFHSIVKNVISNQHVDLINQLITNSK